MSIPAEFTREAVAAASRDVEAPYRDFAEWGYCLIEEATSPARTQALGERVVEQAAAERALITAL